jgi:hypothetical protein
MIRKMQFTFFDAFDFSGKWWIPGEDREPKRGKLSFQPGRFMQLKLDSPSYGDFIFGDIEGDLKIPDYLLHPIMQGITDNGYHITLANCEEIRGIGFFTPQYMLVSNKPIECNTIDELTFKRISARYTHLEQWFSSFTPLRFGNVSNPVQYIPPQAIKIPVPAISGEIYFGPNQETSMQNYEASVKFTASVEICLEAPQPLTWLIEQLQHVQDLLAILVGKPVRKLNVFSPSVQDSNTKNIEPKIYIFHAVPPPDDIKPIHASKMILSAQDLGSSIQSVFAAWFASETRELWEALRDVYFGVHYNTIRVPRFQFLALMQVIESYHRRKYPDQNYQTRKEYEKYRKQLVDAIPDEFDPAHRASLKNRIKYGYQYSLRKRLELLLENLGSELRKVIGIEDIVGEIVESRNYFTHYDPDDETVVFTHNELKQVNSRLAALIVALILSKELSISEEIIVNALNRLRDLGRLQ